MQKLSSITGSARHGFERMAPSFGRSSTEQPAPPMMPMPPYQHKRTTLPVSAHGIQGPQRDSMGCISFNIPWNTSLIGPEPDSILYATPDAKERWLEPFEIESSLPPEELPPLTPPVHMINQRLLQDVCAQLCLETRGEVEALATLDEVQPIVYAKRLPKRGYVSNVALSGRHVLLSSVKARILSSVPIALRRATIDIENRWIYNIMTDTIRREIIDFLNEIKISRSVDAFIVKKQSHQTKELDSLQESDRAWDQNVQIVLYGTQDEVNVVKMLVMIYIDQLDGHVLQTIRPDRALQAILPGRKRLIARQIELATNTAIYLPPSFVGLYGYHPPDADRLPVEIHVTGPNMYDVNEACQRLYEVMENNKMIVVEKTLDLPGHKLDSIILERLTHVKQYMSINCTHIAFPPFGSGVGTIKIYGHDQLGLERTARQIMELASQTYSGNWILLNLDMSTPSGYLPGQADMRSLLAGITRDSGAESIFEDSPIRFTVQGSDDDVKAAMAALSSLEFVGRAKSQMGFQVELANAHKDFVSGKKNGKINKIMTQCNVQVMFDGFNEYNFLIIICGQTYNDVTVGLDLVEQEMPASLSFYIPDQYHKKIIGMAGQHIQRLMKKYSVFVKFSNAMDRGANKDDDEVKVDNVVCRTPARNAANLDLVKQDLLELIDTSDRDFTSEDVVVDRLYQRILMRRVSEVHPIEKKWNCKIDFPATETGSDVVTIFGPEYQIPFVRDEFLKLIEEDHDLSILCNQALRDYLHSTQFKSEVSDPIKAQYEVALALIPRSPPLDDKPDANVEKEEHITLRYTRNNAGNLRDAINTLVHHLVKHGLDINTVKSSFTQPDEENFDHRLSVFGSKVFQPARVSRNPDSRKTSVSTPDDAPKRPSMFDKLRRPGNISSLTSFLGRPKAASGSSSSLARLASGNVSKASLISMESRESNFRNPWLENPVEDDPTTTNGHPHSTSRHSATTTPSIWSHRASDASLTFTHPHGTPSSSVHNFPLFRAVGSGGSTGSAGDLTPTSTAADTKLPASLQQMNIAPVTLPSLATPMALNNSRRGSRPSTGNSLAQYTSSHAHSRSGNSSVTSNTSPSPGSSLARPVQIVVDEPGTPSTTTKQK